MIKDVQKDLQRHTQQQKFFQHVTRLQSANQQQLKETEKVEAELQKLMEKSQQQPK